MVLEVEKMKTCKFIKRAIAMLSAVCILVMTVGNSVVVFADETENESLAIMADNITINAGNKQVNGMAAKKQDIYHMSSAIIATLPEETVDGEQYYTAQNKYEIKGGFYFDKSVMFATTDVVVSDTLVSKGNIEVYVDTFTSEDTTFLFTQEGNIIVNATKVELDGLLYAPNGNITINAGTVDITGTIIANDVTINASDVKITADEELVNYINYICNVVSDEYIDIRGFLFDTEYTFSVETDKEIEYADVYVRVDSEEAFHKLTTVYNPVEESTIEIDYETTVDITVVGYTKYGEKVDAEIETYGKDEYGSLYYKQDTDEDGISDGMEIWYLGSNPYVMDTDGDGFDDYYEVMVLNTDSVIVTEDGDYDEDGVTNKSEMLNGTNPYLADTDFDGIVDNIDAEPVKYNSGYEKDEVDYKVVVTAFDAKKTYVDEEGNVYVYIINKLTGQEKALLGNDKNTVVYYDAKGRTGTVLREIAGVYKINTYEYNENDKVIGISNNGYRYDITYGEDNEIEEVYLNGELLICHDDIESEVSSEYNEDRFVIEYNDMEEKYITVYKLDEEEMVYEITGDEDNNIYSKLISGADMEVLNGDNIKNISIKETETTISNAIEHIDEVVNKITYNDGKTISYEYDENGYISKIRANDVLTNEYLYDGFGQLVKDVDYVSGKTTEYSYKYDNIKDVKVYQGENLVEQKEYIYDEVYADKLIKVGNDEISYDNAGNINGFKGVEYQYNNGNLSKIVKDNTTSEYIYNENGQRVQKIINGVVTDYYYENERLIVEKSEDNTIWYIYGNSDEKVGFIHNSVTYYYERNAMGDIVNILDTAGNILVTYAYDVWGNVTIITGDETLADINPIRYRGYYFDRESGLYYLNTRYYNSEIGRFMSLDEAVAIINSTDNYNLYAYCCNNPVNHYDPDGREKVNVRIFVDKDFFIDYNNELEAEKGIELHLAYCATAYHNEVKSYINTYGGTVSLYKVSKTSFETYWNNFSWTNTNILVMFAHSTPESFILDGELINTVDIFELKTIHLDLLILSLCNAGHYDYYKNSKTNNVAYMFFNRINNATENTSNRAMVLTSDGTVALSSDLSTLERHRFLFSVPDIEWKIYGDEWGSNRFYNHGWILLRHGYTNVWDAYSRTSISSEKKIIHAGTSYACEGIDFSNTLSGLVANYGLIFTYK